MTIKICLGTALFTLTLGATAAAQDVPNPSPVCAAVDAELPTDLIAWKSRATDAGSTLAIGDAATVTLIPAASARYAVAPEKPGKPGTFGGSATFDVSEAGTYRIALSGPAWIDVVIDGKTVASTAHGHGPECSSIRKIVAFPLKPGRHMLQFSGSPEPAIAVLVTLAP